MNTLSTTRDSTAGWKSGFAKWPKHPHAIHAPLGPKLSGRIVGSSSSFIKALRSLASKPRDRITCLYSASVPFHAPSQLRALDLILPPRSGAMRNKPSITDPVTIPTTIPINDHPNISISTYVGAGVSM